MKEEQLKFFGNIIEFPKNKEFRNKEILDKYYVAIKLLKYIADKGHDFNITVTKSAALEIFNDYDGIITDLVVLSTSKEFEKTIKNKRKTYYFIKGSELY